MKLKYYLRGIGIGIIVATLIMTVSSTIHNNNLTDEFIMKEAQKLGMVMPENEDNHDSLWGSSTETEVDTQTTNDTQIDNNQTEDTQTNNTQVNDTQTEDSQLNDTQADDTQVSDSQASEEATMVTITITDSDGAGRVAERLRSLGVLENATEFHTYILNNDYSRRIKTGTFQVPIDATYEEICDIIINKN